MSCSSDTREFASQCLTLDKLYWAQYSKICKEMNISDATASCKVPLYLALRKRLLHKQRQFAPNQRELEDDMCNPKIEECTRQVRQRYLTLRQKVQHRKLLATESFLEQNRLRFQVERAMLEVEQRSAISEPEITDDQRSLGLSINDTSSLRSWRDDASFADSVGASSASAMWALMCRKEFSSIANNLGSETQPKTPESNLGLISSPSKHTSVGISALAVSNPQNEDGSQEYIAFGNECGDVTVADIHFRDVSRAHAHRGSVLSVCWSQTGDRCCSSGSDGRIHVWKIYSNASPQSKATEHSAVASFTLSCERTMSMDPPARRMAYFPTNPNLLLTVTSKMEKSWRSMRKRGYLCVLNVSTGMTVQELRHEQDITSFEFSANGNDVYFCDVSGHIMLCECEMDVHKQSKSPLRKPKIVLKLSAPAASSVMREQTSNKDAFGLSCMSVVPFDERVRASALLCVDVQCQCRVMTMSVADRVAEHSSLERLFNSNISLRFTSCCALISDGSCFGCAFGCSDGCVCVYTHTSSTVTHRSELLHHNTRISAVASACNGKAVIAGDSNGVVTVWVHADTLTTTEDMSSEHAIVRTMACII